MGRAGASASAQPFLGAEWPRVCTAQADRRTVLESPVLPGTKSRRDSLPFPCWAIFKGWTKGDNEFPELNGDVNPSNWAIEDVRFWG